MKATEKSRMMADTIDSVSCDQKPIHPKRRQAAAALCRLRRAGSGSRPPLLAPPPPFGLSLASGRKLALLPELLPEWPELEAAPQTCRSTGGRGLGRVPAQFGARGLLVVLPELEGREYWQSCRPDLLQP